MSVKVLITEKKGYPIAVVSGTGNAPCRVYKSRARRLRYGPTGELIMPIGDLWQFISLNKNAFGLDSIDDVEIDKASKPYYGYEKHGETVFRSRLTDKFIEDFFNYDASRLVRYEPNTTDARNMLGMRLAEFETVIFESTFNGVSVDEDTTVEECEQIRKACHPESNAYRALTVHIEVVSNPDIDVANIEKQVTDYEAQLQAIFDKYADDVKELIETLPVHPLDCGFTIVHTNNAEMKKNYQKLISLGKRSNANVDVKFPDNYFCCSQSRPILKKLKEWSNAPILDTIFVQTILD
jgi:hypothetical protein